MTGGRHGDQRLSFARFRRVRRLPCQARRRSDAAQCRGEGQEDFKDLGGNTLDKLDVYIAACDAVVHLVGDMYGPRRTKGNSKRCSPSIPIFLRSCRRSAKRSNGVCLPYTQWEAWLALYYGKPLMIVKAAAAAPRGPKYAANDATPGSQAEHLKRLKAFHRYPGSEFGNPDELAKQIAYTAILDFAGRGLR